ncbi:MAG: hypothetical protein AAGN66_10450 [Acidobacteriota bacterium]
MDANELARERHLIRVGDREIPLPNGVTLDQWSRERTYWQNPRIRSFLGCIRLLGGVMESNYAILHCSPERLTEIWRKVREVADLMLTQLAPLLDQPSRIPDLEEARSHAEVAMTMLAETVLDDLRRFPQEDVPPEQMLEVRKLLCVSIGKIHAFLQDTFGQLMASDPRSQHDADYFLSRRFPQDVEEAEWLLTTVEKLSHYLGSLELERRHRLVPTLRSLRSEQTIPTERAWRDVETFLDLLLAQLTPKLKEVLALRGIRFHEMEILDRYAGELPVQCRLCCELFEASREATELMKATSGPSRSEREQSVRDLMQCHMVWSARLASLLTDIDTSLRDIAAFIPLWLDGIEMRRALLLKRGQGPPPPDSEAAANPGALFDD